MNRVDIFEGTGPAPGSYFKTKIGATKDGKIVAAHAYMVFEAGAFPGGPIATAAMGAWIVWEARNLGMSKWQLTRMAANVGIDTLVGAIPFAGDIFDFLYKSNTKNLRIIRKHLDRHHPATAVIDQ